MDGDTKETRHSKHSRTDTQFDLTETLAACTDLHGSAPDRFTVLRRKMDMRPHP